MSSLTVEDYHVGWICALSIEMSAAMAMLEEEHEMLAGQDRHDHNNYVLGRIHQHNVAIACMPEGVDGLVTAATVARDMARTFPALRIGLMVGIGGGIPNLSQGIDIRLGDIVVSKPEKSWGGVVQYDKGKSESGGKFVVKGQLNQPPDMLLRTLARLRAVHAMRASKVPSYMNEAIERNPMMEESGFTRPVEPDCLYCGICNQDIESSAADCSETHKRRKQRKNNYPAIHYGIIASGNQVIKDAKVRDCLRGQFGALCVEMEAAGLMNQFPCLVIRGICDYADMHKNDAWHPYAAMTAAAYAKELLYYVSPAQASQEKPIQQVLGLLNEQIQASKAHFELTQQQLEATKAQSKQNNDRYRNDEQRRCHQVFKTSTYEKFKNINPDREEGTCQWVLSHSQFIYWKQSLKNDLLWISADPGCGKSVLAKFLVDDKLKSSRSHTMCYFFFKDNDEQDHLNTALSALLHQLFAHQPHLIRHGLPAWERNGKNITKEVDEMWRILEDATGDADCHDVTCILDALDECRDQDQRDLIHHLTRFYTQQLSSSTRTSGRLKFLVTSRPYDDIQARFQAIPPNLPTIRLRGEDRNDDIRREIDSVVRARVASLVSEFQLLPSSQKELLGKLLNMEHRTYLWLHLAMNAIRENYRNSLWPDSEAIDFLPSSVDDAYEKILSQVTDNRKATVRKILQIVVGARRPLNIGEMALALGVAMAKQHTCLADVRTKGSHLQDHIRQWCGLFVFINHSRIYLIHQTAKEFLLQTSCHVGLWPHQWKYSLDFLGVEMNMTEICVKFLLLDDVAVPADSLLIKLTDSSGREHFQPTGDVGSFVDYSAEYWTSHLGEARLPGNNTLMEDVLRLYETESDAFRLWFQSFWRLKSMQEDTPSMNSIRLAAFTGHEQVMSLVLSKAHNNIDEEDESGRSALYWACKFGNISIVHMLLTRGADVDGGSDPCSITPLCTVAETGRVELANILLQKGANVNKAGFNGLTPLHITIKEGHIEMMKMLLHHGANVNQKIVTGSTSHRIYVETNDLDVLMGKGANKNRYVWTPLHIAAKKGHIETVKTLLGLGARTDMANLYEETPLHVAVETGHVEVAKMLLENDVSMEIASHRDAALKVAAQNGDIEMMKILRSKGANVNPQNREVDTPLHIAVKQGHIEVVKKLLEWGANVNIKNPYQKTPLHIACENRHVEVVGILSKKGAYLNADDGSWKTPLYGAVENGYLDIVKTLLEAGADVNNNKDWEKMPLDVAVEHGHAEIVGLLLEKGANVEGSKWRKPPLWVATLNGHVEVVRLLLEKDADVNKAHEKVGFPPLYTAAGYGHVEIVNMLLQKGADPNKADDSYGFTPLYIAAGNGQTEVVKILLNSGAEIDKPNKAGYTPLRAATANGEAEVVTLLQNSGANMTRAT